MGTSGLLSFKNTLGLIRDGRSERAAEAMMKSKWASQTPNRAQRIANQMRTGKWH